jgi:vacuolar-type H+-ATPase subunit F/Vma7
MTNALSPGQGSPRSFGSRDAAAARVSGTRIIALGSAALMDGFRLAGIEVMPNATPSQLEMLLKSLVTGKEKALVLIEADLLSETGPWLHRVQSEGGRVVVMQVPSLARAGEYHPAADRLVGVSGQGEAG